jgi:hypothetical protein
MYKHKTFTLFRFVILTMIVVSCNKSKSVEQPQNALAGNWTFVSMKVQTKSTVQETIAGSVESAVTTTNYTTIKNAGTITFSTDSLFAVGLTYTVADSVRAYEYENGQFQDSLILPYNLTLPPMNSSSKYQLIGTDSLYFPGGGGFSPSLPGGQATVASGGRIAFNGNSMTLTTKINQTTTQNMGGVSATSVVQATAVITLQKQ